MKVLSAIGTALGLLAPIVASADKLNCTITASKFTMNTEMVSKAKVSADDAKKVALDAVKAPGATIAKGGLEVEDGCLVYSYDVKVPGKSGIQEVIIDAGSG